jgi:hypothetical protein
MKRISASLVLLIFSAISLFAQDPFPCGAQVVGADECPDACIACSNAQFLNVNTSTEVMTPSGTTTTWCSTIENDQYLGFIAGSSTASITFTNTGCTTGSGLQAAIHGPQCSGTTQGCQTGINVGASATITRTGLIVGEIYYLVIDGIAGAVCGLQIVNASGIGAPIPNIINISGPVAVCPGKEWEYTAISAGATRFNWRLTTKPAGSTITINDDPWPNAPAVVTTTDPTIRVTYSLPGTYTFCVQGENFCNRSTFRCITVVVTRPTRPAQVRTLCDNDIIPWCNNEPNFDASLYPAPSTQRLICFFEEPNGCIGEQDWTFNILRSTILPPLDTALCEGESLLFQDDFGQVGPYNQQGNYDVKLKRIRPRCDDNFQLFLQYIDINPIIAPVFNLSCSGGQVFIDATGTIFGPSNASAVFNWSGPGIVSGQGSRRIIVNAQGIYTLTITVTLRYGQGQRKTKICTKMVDVFVDGSIDIIAPTLVGIPINTRAQCDNIPVPPIVTATDNCPNPIIVLTTTIIPGSCPSNYTLVRTWTASDAAGNTTSASQQILVSDTGRPIINGVPGDSNADCKNIPLPANPTVIDNCDPSVVISYNQIRINGTCLDKYSLIRTWTATDNCNNTIAQSQIITINDITSPTFTTAVPPNITANCNSIPTPITPLAIDNCANSVSISFGTVRIGSICSNSHTLIRTWIASDNCSNTTSQSQSISVINITNPTLVGIPANITVNCNEVPTPANPTAIDICTGSVTISYNQLKTNGDCPGNYILTRTWTARDNCLNTSSQSQVITVQDITSPSLIGVPSNTTVDCNSIPAPANPTANDNCDTAPIISYNQIRTNGNCVSNYTLTRTWTATDNCNNSRTQSQIITVQDITSPSLIGVPSNTTVNCNSIPVPVNPTANDNCDTAPTITYNQIRTNGNCLFNYILTRTWTASDNCNNSRTQSQVITVQDITSPSLDGVPINITVDCNAIPTPANPTANDNCDGTPSIIYNQIRTNGNCLYNYTLTRTWTATDNCNNSRTQSQIITVQDITSPSLVGVPLNTTVDCSSIPAPANPTTMDNCDTAPTITYNQIRTNGNCLHNYTLTRTWTATDSCNNSAIQSQVITVQDIINPIALCKPITKNLGSTGIVTILGSEVDNGSNDACSEVSLSISPSTFNCTNIGNNIVTLNVRDACLNLATCTTTITVNDNTPPVITCPTNSSIQLAPIQCNAKLDYAVTATDNCSATITQLSGLPSGSFFPIGSTIQTFRAIDGSGNSATCSFTVQVLEFVPVNSSLICHNQVNVSIEPALNCIANITADKVLSGNNYGCISNYVVSVTGLPTPVVTSAMVGMTLQYSVTDPRTGNTCWGNLLIEDKLAPAITCTNRTVVGCGTPAPSPNTLPGGGSWNGQTLTVTNSTNFRFSSPDLTGVDCSSNYTLSYQDQAIGNQDACAVSRRINRTFTATDLMGRFSVCTQELTLVRPDLTAITFPGNVEVACGTVIGSIQQTGVPRAGTQNLWPNSGGCGWNTRFVDDTILGCGSTRKIVRTWTVMDWCATAPNNIRTGVQTISITDKIAPTIEFPMNMVDTIGMDNTNCVSNDFLPVPIVNEACSGIASIKAFALDGGSIQDINPSLGYFRYIGGLAGAKRIRYEATDGCGNVSTLIRNIWVKDNIVPVVACTRNTIVTLSSTGTAKAFAPTFDAGSWDNCGIKKLQVRRMTPVCGGLLDGRDGLTFGDWIPFRCCEVNQSIQVVLEAEDFSGNKNTCMVEITPQDKVAPNIICPKDFTVTCDGCNDLSQQGLASDNSPFGYVRSRAIDIKNGDIFSKDAFDADLDCDYNECNKIGSITDGIVNDECLRDIQILVQIDKKCGWDLVAGQPEVTTIRRTFTARDLANNSATCRQTIIVNPRSNFAVQFPNDVTITTCPTDPGNTGEPVFTDVDCEVIATEFEDERFNVPSTDGCYKILRKWKVINWCVFNPLGGRVKGLNEIESGRDFDCDGTLEKNVYRDGLSQNSSGYIEYTQIIIVKDQVAPIFTDTTTYKEVCDFTANDPSLFGAVCESPVSISILATDACSPNAITYAWTLDRDANGSIDFQSNPNTGSINHTFNAELPYGRHKLIFTAMDGCGNMSSKEIIILVKDCKKPTIVCKAGLSANLMNVNPPMVSVWASDFVLYAEDNCGPVSDIRIKRGTAFPPSSNSSSTPPAPSSTSLNFTCADISAPVPVEIWGRDDAGNWDYCVTFISIQDNMARCGSTSPRVVVSGNISTEIGNVPDSIEVSVNGLNPIWVNSGGDYSIGNIIKGSDVTIHPKKYNDDWTNGVNTRDLSLIAQHILGTRTLSPLRQLSGDANNDGNVRASDIAELRKLILGVTNSLPNGRSWRFIPKNCLPNLICNPSINNIQKDETLDFYILKIGDVDASANFFGVQVRNSEKTNWTIQDKEFSSGELVEAKIVFPIQSEISSLDGYQFTLGFDGKYINPEISSIDGPIGFSSSNFAYFKNRNRLTVSYSDKVDRGSNILTLKFVATQNGKLSDALFLNDEITASESYSNAQIFQPELSFINSDLHFFLGQNMPNPSTGLTVIPVNLSKNGIMTLKLTDVFGRSVLVKEIEGVKGNNLIEVDTQGLPAGTYQYQVQSGNESAVRKMIILK